MGNVNSQKNGVDLCIQSITVCNVTFYGFTVNHVCVCVSTFAMIWMRRKKKKRAIWNSNGDDECNYITSINEGIDLDFIYLSIIIKRKRKD
jgi:hypothetical protein